MYLLEMHHGVTATRKFRSEIPSTTRAFLSAEQADWGRLDLILLVDFVRSLIAPFHATSGESEFIPVWCPLEFLFSLSREKKHFFSSQALFGSSSL